MNISVDLLIGMEEVIKSAAITQGTQEKEISTEKWLKWLLAEHSMIRSMQLRINMLNIPYYAAMHLVRHTQGVLPYVRSQRDTAINPVNYDRHKAPQDSPVNYCPIVNPQSLINISRKRLCNNADKTTKLVWEEVKFQILQHENAYVSRIALVMQPDCVYRGNRCFELISCGKFSSVNWRKYGE